MLGEIHRKAIHASSLVIPVGYYLLPDEAGRRALLVAALVAIIIESLRLNEPHLRRLTVKLVGALLREREKTGLFGSTYLILGSLLCAYSFSNSKAIVVTSILFLIVGDAAAALVGRIFGRVQIFGKTLEGSLACLAVCLVIGILMAIHVPDLTIKAAITGAVTATIFELLPIPLDDNFRIPLSAGFAMRLVMS